jgi:tetratricopeptide (TPR) repeat protein
MLLQNVDKSADISKADIFCNLGRAHAALGEKAKAVSMFERGLEIAPEHEGLKQGMAEASS